MTTGAVGPKLTGKRFILVGGPGGVGKTTLAAAIGLRLAEQGHRTLVLTVDPAKRLAQALGFEHFSFELEQVKFPDKPDMQLFASMLDSRRYFDRIISRYATSESQREKIFANPIYRTMVDQLGGTHEYAAMERLAEFAEDPRFDRIVVDTPPAPNAIDLLQAPQRLAEFMDNAVMKWFQTSSGGPLKIFQRGTRLAMKAVEKIFGSEFIGAFSTLMDDIEGMQGKFKKTSLEVLELLRSERLAFLLVTYPSEARLEESVSFVETLRQERISLSGVVLNRVEVPPPPLPDPLPAMPPEESNGLYAWERYQRAIGECHQAWVTRFHERLPGVPHQSLRALEKPPGDLATLRALGEELL